MVLVLLLAAALRLSGVAWDGGIGAHPDERYVVGVAEGLEWPRRLNPFALAPDLAYGHLPLTLFALLGGVDRLLAARLLTALVDTATVALAAALGSRLFDRGVGLLAAGFLAVMPLHVQQAHFATVDVFLAFFVTAAVLFATRVAECGRPVDAALAGLAAGLAFGCKAGAGLLALPLAAACWFSGTHGRSRLLRCLLVGGVALVAFAVTNPFAVLQLPRFLRNVAAQTALAQGTIVAPYALQYQGTLPYLYPVFQQAIWGMGPVLAGLCFGGLGVAVAGAVRRPPTRVEWVALAWAVPFFAFVGGLYAKFPRYLLPLSPLLVVYGAVWLAGVQPRAARAVLGALALVPAGMVALGMVLSYAEAHPWVAATHWVEAQVPRGTGIAVEAWDHPLPLDSEGYHLHTLPVFEPDTGEKRAQMEASLDQANVVVVASRRGYGVLTDRPPMASYYQFLFAGQRDFEVAACFGRWPRVGPLALSDDPFRAADLPLPQADCLPQPPVLWLPPLDESFVVYDHPTTIILVSTRRSSRIDTD
jgi:4-amino-4-deoxy-L-arabinose transferase-like glycosyltransferase